MELSQTPAHVTVSEFVAGTLIAGRYEIVECCGSGGWGTVYKAWDVHTKTTVAVKFLHAHLVRHSESLSRFKNEAEASCKLVHPNIVAVHDYGVVNGRPFLVMEYLTGKNLSTTLAQSGPLNQELFIDCFGQLCDALTIAHSRGIVHRDIKPSNIVLERDCRGNTTAKLVDFGMAKLFDPEGRSVEQLTATGETLGTPAYMSPEQCTGSKLDERSDLYSLGCVMYEACTGVQPFVSDSIMSTMYKQLNDAPPPMRESAPGVDVSPTLEAVILQTLAKDPHKRPSNAQALRAAIVRAADAHGIGGAWRLWQARTNLRSKRHSESWLVVALAIGLISASGLLIASLRPPHQEVHQEKHPQSQQNEDRRPAKQPQTVPVTRPQIPPKLPAIKPKVIPLPQSVIDDLGLSQPKKTSSTPLRLPTLPTPVKVPDGKYDPRYENTLVRGSGPYVWLIKDGWRARVPMGDTAAHLRSQGIPLYSMDNSVLNKIPRNFDVDPIGTAPKLQPYPPSMEGVMVYAPPAGAVWLLKSGELHWVPDGETVNQLRKEGHSLTAYSPESINLVPHTYQNGQDVPSVKRH